MNLIRWVALGLISAGAVVMLVNLSKFHRTTRLLLEFSKEEHGKLKHFFSLHQALILFFTAGYMTVIMAMVMEIHLIGNLFVGLIFFFGAIFVLFGIFLQNEMIATIKKAYDRALDTSAKLEKKQDKLIQEIRDRKEAQAALQHSQFFLQQIIDSFPESLVVINLDYTVALSNQHAKQQAQSALISEPITCHQLLHHSAHPCAEHTHPCPLRSVIQNKTTVTMEHTHSNAHGKPTIVEIIAAPIFANNGEVVQIIESCRDITTRKRMEERVAQMQKMDAIGTLAGGIAHDFNNILAAMMGYTELSLFEAQPDTSLSVKLNRILTAGKRAKDLINQILTFSRRKSVELKAVRLQPIILETLNLLRASIPAFIEFHQELHAHTGVIMADPTQIHQILMNLCTNAAHAMRDNGGRLLVALEPCDYSPATTLGDLNLPEGPYLRLSVSDTGHGMDAKTLERIFEPFFTTKAVGEGTGLGLAAVHGIVKQIGGVITVESKPGIGSTFTIYFPHMETEVLEQPCEHKQRRNGHEHILLVDDEPSLVEIIGEMLTVFGYKILSAGNGPEALKIFQADPAGIDLVLTDQTMPQMSGEKLIDELRRIRPDIPVILCTGIGDQFFKQDPGENSFNGLLLKPVMMDDLTAMVRKVLDNRNHQ